MVDDCLSHFGLVSAVTTRSVPPHVTSHTHTASRTVPLPRPPPPLSLVAPHFTYFGFLPLLTYKLVLRQRHVVFAMQDWNGPTAIRKRNGRALPLQLASLPVLRATICIPARSEGSAFLAVHSLMHARCDLSCGALEVGRWFTAWNVQVRQLSGRAVRMLYYIEFRAFHLRTFQGGSSTSVLH